MDPLLPWYFAGPLIGLIVPALLFLREKQFGMSSSFSYVLSVILPRDNYFKSANTTSKWQFQFALGIICSAIVARFFIDADDLIINDLNSVGTYITNQVYTVENSLAFFIGGVLIGFGARYANGCTAGNCIMGVSQFSLSSIVATVAFFVAGLITAQFINPILF